MVNAIGDITGVKTAVTAAVYAANINSKTPAALASINYNTTIYTAGVNNKISAALANIAYNTLNTVMAGNSPNYKLIYIYPGKANA